jgi:hypothetical protein
MTRATCTLLGAVFALSTLTANASSIYNFVTFNGPGDNGGGTTANAISNSGAIVGFSANASDTLFTNFVLNPNQTFSTLNIVNDPLANANGINSAGTVVGFSQNQAFSLNSTNGTLNFLPAAAPGMTSFETAFGINDQWTIVGQFTDNATDTTPGFVDAGGTFTILSPLPNAAVTNAQSINDNGLVVGFYSSDGVHQHGFLYNTITGQYTLVPDPVQPNLVLTQFLGINDEGIAVGYWQDAAGAQHGFLYNTNTQTYTFLDDPNVPTGGFSITQITGINDSGEIDGFYVDPNGVQRGFFANPVASAAPEPASFTLTATAAGLLMIVALRNQREARCLVVLGHKLVQPRWRPCSPLNLSLGRCPSFSGLQAVLRVLVV